MNSNRPFLILEAADILKELTNQKTYVMTLRIAFILAFIVQMSSASDSDRHITNGNYLFFLPNNDIVSLARYEVEFGASDSSEHYDEFMILSHEDGRVMKRVQLRGEGLPATELFTVAQDGSSVVLFMSTGLGKKIGPPYFLSQYSLSEDRWSWTVRWDSTNIPLRLGYSEDSKQIICVSTHSTVLLDAESGSVVRQSNAISSIEDSDGEFIRYDMSKNGRYFAFWSAKFLKFSSGDESGVLRLLDISWYGMRWLYHFGKIPHWLYVWDVFQDSLLVKISIPYETIRGTPVFSQDEQEVVVGPFDGIYSVFSLDKAGTLSREYSHHDSLNADYVEIRLYGNVSNDYKILSPDNRYLAECYDVSDVLLLDHVDGSLIRKWARGNLFYPNDRYAMAFSSDNKFFAIVTRGGKIHLYESGTWNQVWLSAMDLSRSERHLTPPAPKTALPSSVPRQRLRV